MGRHPKQALMSPHHVSSKTVLFNPPIRKVGLCGTFTQQLMNTALPALAKTVQFRGVIWMLNAWFTTV